MGVLLQNESAKQRISEKVLEIKSDIIFENGTADAQMTRWYANQREYYVTAL